MKIASMQATLMLINSIIIIVTNYLAVLPIVEVHNRVTSLHNSISKIFTNHCLRFTLSINNNNTYT